MSSRKIGNDMYPPINQPGSAKRRRRTIIGAIIGATLVVGLPAIALAIQHDSVFSSATTGGTTPPVVQTTTPSTFPGETIPAVTTTVPSGIGTPPSTPVTFSSLTGPSCVPDGGSAIQGVLATRHIVVTADGQPLDVGGIGFQVCVAVQRDLIQQNLAAGGPAQNPTLPPVTTASTAEVQAGIAETVLDQLLYMDAVAQGQAATQAEVQASGMTGDPQGIERAVTIGKMFNGVAGGTKGQALAARILSYLQSALRSHHVNVTGDTGWTPSTFGQGIANIASAKAASG